MVTRRQFIGSASIATAALSNSSKSFAKSTVPSTTIGGTLTGPLVISTWRHGLPANEAAWETLSRGGGALDAVEKGVRVTESNPKISTVGIGGFPDASGTVTLDACIMNEKGECGS